MLYIAHISLNPLKCTRHISTRLVSVSSNTDYYAFLRVVLHMFEFNNNNSGSFFYTKKKELRQKYVLTPNLWTFWRWISICPVRNWGMSADSKSMSVLAQNLRLFWQKRGERPDTNSVHIPTWNFCCVRWPVCALKPSLPLWWRTLRWCPCIQTIMCAWGYSISSVPLVSEISKTK